MYEVACDHFVIKSELFQVRKMGGCEDQGDFQQGSRYEMLHPEESVSRKSVVWEKGRRFNVINAGGATRDVHVALSVYSCLNNDCTR